MSIGVLEDKKVQSSNYFYIATGSSSIQKASQGRRGKEGTIQNSQFALFF